MNRKLALLGIAVVIGCAIQVLFLQVRDWSVFGQIDSSDATTDFVLRMNAKSPNPIGQPTPAVVVDFDDEAMQRAGWPRIVPRDALARILTNAVDGGAKLIVLDLDLGIATGEDAALAAALSHAERKGIPVIIVRELVASSATEPYELGSSAFDALIKDSEWLTYASAAYAREGDGIVRRLGPAVVWCDEGVPQVLPGVHVLAAESLHAAPNQPAWLSIKANAKPPSRCVSGAQAVLNATSTTGTSTHTFFKAADQSRILYRTPWRPRASDLVERLPGGAFLADAPVNNRVFNDRVVLIGSSSQLSRDTHNTPLGFMPGVAIIATAIQQAELGLVAKQASAWWSVALGGLASFGTWLLWLAFGRLTPWLNSEISNELLKFTASGLWSLAALTAFSSSAILSFAAPQYAVALFLIVVASLEDRPSKEQRL
jgi:CHASE2 domain-containing sensor protein